jgi:hypothetical protein
MLSRYLEDPEARQADAKESGTDDGFPSVLTMGKVKIGIHKSVVVPTGSIALSSGFLW